MKRDGRASCSGTMTLYVRGEAAALVVFACPLCAKPMALRHDADHTVTRFTLPAGACKD